MLPRSRRCKFASRRNALRSFTPSPIAFSRSLFAPNACSNDGNINACLPSAIARANSARTRSTSSALGEGAAASSEVSSENARLSRVVAAATRERADAVNDRARAPRERSGEHGCLQTRASSVESPCEVCDYECYLFWCLSLRLRLRCLCLFIAFFRFRFTLAMSKNPPISRSASRSSARRRPSSAPTVIPVVACFP